MFEAEYLHECGRAELLGLPKPDREEFIARRQAEISTSELQEDESKLTADEIQEAGAQREGLNRVGGGLDELNTILASTQKKLNRLKNVYGNFKSLLNLQSIIKKENNTDNSNSGQSTIDQTEAETSNSGTQSPKADDMERSVPKSQDNPGTGKNTDPQLSKLDSLIRKAETAELSLSKQNKQMRAMTSSRF